MPFLTLGGTDAHVDTPSTAAWNLSGTDFTIEIDAYSDDWDNGGAVTRLVSKDNVSGNGRSWNLQITTSNNLQFAVFNDAGSLMKTFSGPSVNLSDGERHKIRIEVDVDDGAGGSVVEFFKDDISTGTDTHTSTLTGANAINPDGTTEVRIGVRGDDNGYFAGNLYTFTVWTDLTQTTRFAFADFTDPSQGWPTGTATGGEGFVYTIDGTDFSYVALGNNLLLLGVG